VKRLTNYEEIVMTEQLVDHHWVLVTPRAGLAGAQGSGQVE
jgi:hypothetical protein